MANNKIGFVLLSSVHQPNATHADTDTTAILLSKSNQPADPTRTNTAKNRPMNPRPTP